MIPGPKNALTDVAGLMVGHAQDHDVKTGTTIVVGDAPFTCGVHVMGGAPGTRETDLLAPDKTVEQVDALVLSGGSAFGLDAAAGVVDWLRAQGRGFQVGPHRVPIVPAAILFDLMNGGNKDWADSPYRALGQAACQALAPDVPVGTVGAGAGATTATLKGGLGTASYVLPNGGTVAAMIAVNALGSATVDGTRHFWAAPYEEGGEFGQLGQPDQFPKGMPATKLGPAQNTTIGIVATDFALTKAQCTRLATAAHDGFARALMPAHTPMDGDLIFAAATGKRPLTDDVADTIMLGHAAAQCVARAIAIGVYSAEPHPNDLLPCWKDDK
jgi:D-aminopeptidase